MMAVFIRELFDDKESEKAHKIIKRFGMGTYPRETIYITRTAKSIKIQTGFEYTESLINLLCDLSSDDVTFKGKIISGKNLEPLLEKHGVKIEKSASKGKKIDLKEQTMSMDSFKKLVTDLNDTFALLSAKTGDYDLKVKTKMPKPGNLLEKHTTLILKLSDEDTVKEQFLFDVDAGKFKKVQIETTYEIEDLEIPDEAKDDPAKARLMARRKGKVKRKIMIDGEEQEKEFEFKS